MIDGMSSEYETVTYESGLTSNYTSGTFGNATVTNLTSTVGSITTLQSTTANVGTVNATTGVITTLSSSNSVVGSNTGTIVQLPVDANTSGGMFVTSESGTVMLCSPAGATEVNPLGMCLSDTASGGTANILVKGIYYCISNGTITPGDELIVGAANTDVVNVASGAFSAFNRVGKSLNDQASGTALLVPVLINLV